jgi:hypothetical protein
MNEVSFGDSLIGDVEALATGSGAPAPRWRA